jgi:general secretion pathway protein E
MLKKSDPVERILLRNNKITEKSLGEIKANQLQVGHYLGKTLVDHGYINADDLLKTLSKDLSIPFLTIDDYPKALLPIKNINISEAFLKEKTIFPIQIKGDTLTIAAFNPFDLHTLENLKISLGKNIKLFLSTEETIVEAIETYYGAGESAMGRMIEGIKDDEKNFNKSEQDTEHIRDMASEAPVIKLVNHIISKATEMGASDIHLEPFAEDLILRYRIDGILHNFEAPPKRLSSSLCTRIKIMAELDISERRLPQDGRIKLKLQGKDIDMRVSTLPTLYGESIVIRILDRGNLNVNLEKMGFPKQELEQFQKLIQKPYGKLLVTGPTGSGKTTTLYGALQNINTSDKKIITIEDPVEYQIRGINQIHVKPQIGLDFASGLRSIVRQDPDVIMVGEIRDAQTADVAIQAALTGHLVFSTVHTNDSAGAITRLLDMSVENYLISSALIGVLAQRLVRVICRKCIEPIKISSALINEMGTKKHDDIKTFYGKGCKECSHTGFRGRVGIYELLIVDDMIRQLILNKSTSQEIREIARKKGMTTLREDGWKKVAEGITTVEEVLRVTINEQT